MKSSRIPGPAGEVLAPLQDNHDGTIPYRTRQYAADADQDNSGSGPDENFCQMPSWMTMLSNVGDNLPPCDLLEELSKSGSNHNIPRLAVSIVCMEIIYSAFATFRDISGFMQGTIHKKVLEEYRGSIDSGAVLVLRNVAIFSPTTSDHFLNICSANVELVVPYQPYSAPISRPISSQSRPLEGKFARPRSPDVNPSQLDRFVRPKCFNDKIESKGLPRLSQNTPSQNPMAISSRSPLPKIDTRVSEVSTKMVPLQSAALNSQDRVIGPNHFPKDIDFDCEDAAGYLSGCLNEDHGVFSSMPKGAAVGGSTGPSASSSFVDCFMQLEKTRPMECKDAALISSVDHPVDNRTASEPYTSNNSIPGRSQLSQPNFIMLSQPSNFPDIDIDIMERDALDL